MDVGFVDLDILLTRIRNEKSRTYFLDAVKSYKAGALRSALTSAWVALVYDLISKYRELSAGGDALATAFITSWDSATATNDTKKLVQLEGSILDDATKKTQIINSIALRHLERVHQDRHLCAHPAFSGDAELFEPSSELVRLHLVNVVDLVLAREPLQGKAIFDLYDLDVQSPGFPVEHSRIIDYVEQRYLERIRAQNIKNFGSVLAKSLIKGVPPQWEVHREKIASSLVAIRERVPEVWGDVSQAIVRLLDGADPDNRSKVIAFISTFPDFWDRVQPSTKMALQETVTNINPNAISDYRILNGVSLPQFREPLLAVIRGLRQDNLAAALATTRISELWPQALYFYQRAGSFRDSETLFVDLIFPFSGALTAENFDQFLDAIIDNGQNWDAAATPSYLRLILYRNDKSNWPTADARNRFYQMVRRYRRFQKYNDVTAAFQEDGWVPPPAPNNPDDE